MDTDETIDTLNCLIETAKNGEFGFRSSAKYLSSTNTQQLFFRRAGECQQAACELQALLVGLGGDAKEGGSATGAMHRGWLAFNGTLAGCSDKAIFEELARGEDAALSSYRKALEQPLSDELRCVVERQFEGVQRHHVQVRALRDLVRTAAV